MPEPITEQPFGLEVVLRGAQDAPPPEPEHEQKPEKVTFSEAQKLRVNTIVAEASKRAGTEARAETARLKTELEAARRSPTPAEPTTDVLVRLAQAESERDQLRNAAQDAKVHAALLTAAGGQFIDASLAVRLMQDNVRLVDGAVMVVDESGNPKLNGAFEPMTVKELAAELASQRPYLTRGEVRGGAGSVPSQGVPTTGPRLEDLFGPKSNGGAANRLAMHDKPQYDRLKRLAREKGLVR